MDWNDLAIEFLTSTPAWGYRRDGYAATEPVALATLALLSRGSERATRGLDWLSRHQLRDGSWSVDDDASGPFWPTSLAILALHAATRRYGEEPFAAPIQRAVDWSLGQRGIAVDKSPELGHDVSLIAWSWAANTHSWVEPTALFVRALKQVGYAEHERTREAVRLLVDRLLPSGGCNYGNTIVLGQELRPHLQPTGLALLALADEGATDARIGRSIAWLAEHLSDQTPAASLAYGLIGLAAIGGECLAGDRSLEVPLRRELGRDASPYRVALLALAGARNSPWFDAIAPASSRPRTASPRAARALQ